MVGRFTAGTWVGEMASVGFSGPVVDTGAMGPGHINAGLETFNASADGSAGTTTHFNVNYGSVGTVGWAKATQNAIAEGAWAWLNALKAYQSADFAWQEVRLSAVEADGTVVNGASVFTMISPLAGGAATMNVAPQNAVVASLQTGGRGPRNRGRMYLPIHTNTAVTTGGLVASAVNTALRAATKTLIDTVNGLLVARMSVVSATHQTYSDIVNVRCGDEIDTQRRRRNGRLETYSSTAVTS